MYLNTNTNTCEKNLKYLNTNTNTFKMYLNTLKYKYFCI